MGSDLTSGGVDRPGSYRNVVAMNLRESSVLDIRGRVEGRLNRDRARTSLLTGESPPGAPSRGPVLWGLPHVSTGPFAQTHHARGWETGVRGRARTSSRTGAARTRTSRPTPFSESASERVGNELVWGCTGNCLLLCSCLSRSLPASSVGHSRPEGLALVHRPTDRDRQGTELQGAGGRGEVSRASAGGPAGALPS